MILLLLLALLAPEAKEPVREEAAARMERKLAQLAENAARGRRGGPPTVLTREEINSYFALRMETRIPKGVSGIRFELFPGRVKASGTVDFDEFKAAARKPVNPLLDGLLRGRKPVAVQGAFQSPGNGYGILHLESVSIGGLTVSGILLDWLLRWFVLPRYPTAAVDRPFRLPVNIQRAVVEQGRVLLYQ